MNKGLREYCKYISQDIGNAGTVNVNINANQANFHLNIPLCTTNSSRPIALSMMYTLSEDTDKTEFGYGVKLNYYKKVRILSDKSKIEMTNSDGSTDYFYRKELSDTYENNMTGSSIKVSYDTYSREVTDYSFTDKFGNIMNFNKNSYYPKYIKYYNGDSYSIDSITTINSINNNKGNTIQFIKTAGLVTKIEVKKDNTIVYLINIVYENERIKTIEHKKNNNTTLFTNTYFFDYIKKEIIVLENRTNLRLKYKYNANKQIISIISGYNADFIAGKQLNIEYLDDNITKVINYKNQEVFYGFDKIDLPKYEIDYNGRAISYKYEYDDEYETIRLMSKSTTIENNPNICSSKNLLKNGFFKDNIDDWTSASGNITVVSDNSHPLYNVLGTEVAKVQSVSNATALLSQEVKYSGIAGDYITLSLWVKELLCGNSDADCLSKAKVSLMKNGAVVSYKIIEFTVYNANNNPWELETISLTSNKSFDSIIIEIFVEQNSIYLFRGVQLLVMPLGAFYEYSDEGNVVNSILDKAKTNSTYTKDGTCPNNLLEQSFGADSNLHNFEYDKLGNMIKSTAPNDVIITNEYDSYNNITSNKISLDSLYLETKYAYSSNGEYLTESIDYLGKKTIYTFNELYGRLKEFITESGIKTAYLYDDFDNIIKTTMSKNNDVSESQCNYDNKKRIDTLVAPNSVTYKFKYNDENKLTNICIKKGINGSDISLNSFTYVNQSSTILPHTYNIEKNIYGKDGDEYQFEYNLNDQITKIKLKRQDSLDSQVIFEYVYNVEGLLYQIKDIVNDKTIYYLYNTQNQIIKVFDESSNYISYQYDNLGSIIGKCICLEGKKQWMSYDYAYRSRGMNPQAVYSTIQTNTMYVSGFFNEYVLDEQTQKYTNKKSKDLVRYFKRGEDTYKESLPPVLGKNLNVTKYSNIPCVYLTTTNEHLAYPVNTYQNYPEPCQTVSFWFYKIGSYSNKYLFSTSRTGTKDFIGVYINSSKKLVLKLIDYAGKVYDNVITTNTIINDGWNFFSLTWYNRYDGLGYADVCQYELVLNNEYKPFKKVDPRYYVNNDYPYAIMHLCCRCNGNSQVDKLAAYVTGIQISNGYNLSYDNISKFYLLTKEYIFESKYQNHNYKCVESSCTNIYTDDQSILNNYEIFPLHNSVISFNEERPLSMQMRSIVTYDRDRTFNYNNAFKRYAYVADGENLVYDFGLQNSGFIGMKVYIDGEDTYQYVFQNYDSYGRTLGVYRYTNRDSNIENMIYIDINGAKRSTGIKLPNNKLTFIGMAWSKTISSDSTNSIAYSIRLKVDNSFFETTIVTGVTLGKMYTSIGRAKNTREVRDISGRFIKYTDCLYGQIEMLCCRNSFLSQSSMNVLQDSLIVKTISNQYDEFGRLGYSSITKDSINIMEKTFDYTSPKVNQTSPWIATEKFIITNENLTIEKNYRYDDEYNINEIIENGQSTKYSYDFRNFLLSEKTTDFDYSYHYYDNGNIKNKIDNITGTTINYQYDIISDRLIRYGDLSINYYNYYFGNPKYYGIINNNGDLVSGIEFKWEGRKLVNYFDNRSNLNIVYTYNSDDLRITKKVNNMETVHYYYDNKKLICEQTGNKIKKYTYNENGDIVAFFYTNNNVTETYYYLKDALSNILGLIDEDGNLVVKYKYDAWGNILSITGSHANTIGKENNIIYKGYYYDFETSLYYCGTRFYNPEWGRWINADDISNLDFSSCTCLNLFSYCGNNPISNIDIYGKSFKSIIASIKNFFKKIGNTIKSLFGGVIKINTSDNQIGGKDAFFGGYEVGVSSTQIIGNGEKPVVFFLEVPKNKWHFWEYKVGVDISIGKFEYGIGTGLISQDISIGWDGTSFDASIGIFEKSYGFSHSETIGNTTITEYSRVYYKPVRLALAVALVAGAVYVAPYIGAAVASATPILAPALGIIIIIAAINEVAGNGNTDNANQ